MLGLCKSLLLENFHAHGKCMKAKTTMFWSCGVGEILLVLWTKDTEYGSKLF